MEIMVEKVGNRIELKSAWQPGLPEMCKSVPGARWSPKDKVWRYPLDFSTCKDLRRVFGSDLMVGSELAAWAREAKAHHEHISSLATQTEASLPMVESEAPFLASALASRTYQQVGARFLHQAGSALLADQPGLGKTAQTLAAIVEAEIEGPIIVVAPSVAVSVTWPQEIGKWLPNDKMWTATGSRAQRQAIIDDLNNARNGEGQHSRLWLLCNTEMMMSSMGATAKIRYPGPSDRHYAWPDLFKIDWASIVLDESHRGVIARSARVSDQSYIRQGLGKLLLRHGGLQIALSGTPFRGKIENLWGLLNWLRPELYPSYWNWIKRWFETYDDGYSLVINGIDENKEDEFYDSLKTVMLRRTKGEIIKELPEKQYGGYERNGVIGVWLDMDGKQKKAYKAMDKSAAADIEGGSVIATGILAEMTRLKQFSTSSGYIDGEQEFHPSLPSNKFDWLLQFLDERGIKSNDPGVSFHGSTVNKVVVASQFTQLINLFSDELLKKGIESHVLTGETSQKRPVDIVNEFQGDGGPRVFLLNTKAGGVSITLDRADDLVFLDETWIPDDQEQVEDRIHRVSRIHNVTIWYLRSIGTIEETVASVTSKREDIQKQLLDGSRGIEFAKRLLEAK